MAITVVQMECFLEVVKRGNFSLAAANLYMSQPTLSRHIQALEEELGAPLFIRANNAVRLTDIGRELCPKLKDMYHRIREMSDELHEVVDQRSGRLRLGILATLRLDDRLRRAIRQVHLRFPESKIQLCHLDLSQSYPALMDGAVDLLMSVDAPLPSSDKVLFVNLYQEAMCMAVPRDHPHADLPNITHWEAEELFSDLEYLLLDAREFEPPIQQALREKQPNYANGYLKRITGTYATLDTLAMMVDAGLAITCMNAGSILGENPRVKLIPLVERNGSEFIPSTVQVNLYWVEKNQNPMLRAFLTALSSMPE